MRRNTNSTNNSNNNSNNSNNSKKGDQTMRRNTNTNSNTNSNSNSNNNSKKGDQTMKNTINEKFASLCAENAALKAKIEAKIEAIEAENAALKAMIEDTQEPVSAPVSNVVLTQKGTVSKKPNRMDRAYQTDLSSKDWTQSLMSSPSSDKAKDVYNTSKSHLKDVWKAIKADRKIGANAYKIMQSVKDEKTLINLINTCQKSVKDLPKPDYGVIHCIIALCSPVIFTTCATSYSMIEGWKVFDKKRAGNAFWGSVCNNRIPSKCADPARIIPLDRVCISVVRLSDCVTSDNWKSYDTLMNAIKLLSSIDIA
jgi:hypothetical protein